MNSLKGIRTLPSSALQNVRHLSTARLAFLMLAGSITAIGCGWSYITDHSVRFNSYRTGRAFYRLPPLPIAVDPKTGKELSTNEIEQYDYQSEDSNIPQSQGTSSEDVWIEARASIENDDLSKAAVLLKKYLDMTSLPTPEYNIGSGNDFHASRNSAYDMLDALTALQHGSSTKAVKAYLEARTKITNSQLTGEEFDDVLKKAIPDANLSDNWAYLRAAQLAHDNAEEALKAFQKHSAQFPASEKHEAVLFMIARLTMQQSYSSNAEGCYIEKPTDQEEANYGQTNKIAIEPKEKCQDKSWHAAIKDFQQLIEKYPHGRYANDARGWIANLYLNGEETALALAEYYRLLGSPDRSVRLEAKKSLQIIGHDYDDDTLERVQRSIADDPNASLAYAYHRIYNVAVDHTYADQNSGCCYDADDQEEKRKIEKDQQTGDHELERVARFATAMIKRYPQASVSGGFVMRVAEAQLELKNSGDANKLARKALSLGVAGDLRAQALWILGSSDHQMKKFAAARSTFNQLIAEYPNNTLTEGARRLLALTAEDQNDLETALDLYLALKYDYDIAYFVDVLLPTDRLATYVEERPNNPQHDELLYALGIRFMRDGRWNEARAALAKVQTKKGSVQSSEDGENEDGVNKGPAFAKEPNWGRDEPHILRRSWIMQDLNTIDALEHLEKLVDEAQGDEAKAEAMYQLASYQFDGNSLLFYNPSAWQGNRYELLSDLSANDRFRLPNECEILFRYSQSHEAVARSIPIYLEIVEKYPKTKAAKDALYSAAVAQQHLSNLNPYWREVYSEGLFVGPKLTTYDDVKRVYPTYQLPRGTNGWEASTRTVNGGPGWAAAPKQPPKLTRLEKVEKLVKQWASAAEDKLQPGFSYAVTSYVSMIRAFLYCILITAGILLIGYAGLLGVHFRNLRSSQAQAELSLIAAADEKLPPSGSRIDKVIDNV